MTEERRKDRLKVLEAAIAAGSQDPFVHYARALELRGRGQLQEALQALAEVEARFPEYVPTFLMAGQIAVELEQPDLARGYLSRGIALAERVGDAHALSELKQALAGLE